MRRGLLTLSLALLLGAVAATAIVANNAAAQAPAARNPVQQAQSGRRAGPPRTPPTEAELASRRTEACENRAALAAGRLAYLEARLELTAAQRAAFTRWRDVRLAAAKRMAGTCAEQPMRGPGRGQANAQATPPNPVERMARQEARLRQRLADLTAERPALEALYNSLTPEQRQKFRPADGRGRGMGGMGRGPRMAMMMRGTMGPRGAGMMRGGPGGPGRGPGMMPPPGDQPPPPPQ